MDTSAAPPYGDLLERARMSTRTSIDRAAAAAGITRQTWINIVKGRTVRPKAETVAAMAIAVGIPPERLHKEGLHPDAAALMREMQRAAPAPVTAPDEAEGEYMRLLLSADPGDVELLQIIARAVDADGLPYPWPRRLHIAREYLRLREPAQHRRAGTALTITPPCSLNNNKEHFLLLVNTCLPVRVTSYSKLKLKLSTLPGTQHGKARRGGEQWARSRPWRRCCP
jgi:transcriptional regulator with XRE-family HTH domain